MTEPMLSAEEVAQIITLLRRAPLQNMAEAEVVAQLMRKLAAEYEPKQEVEEPPAVHMPRKRKSLNGDTPQP